MDGAALPAACSHQVDRFLGGEKSSAALLFSGLFLGLVGIAFTILGWKHNNLNISFDWTQLSDLSHTSGVTHDAPVTSSELPPHYDTLCTDNRTPENAGTSARSPKSPEVCSEAETSPPAYEDIYPSTN
ncbi:hypothetical protein WMY93_021203 [Mugilogobius chulae]|uniref:Uncharacterized protein n=1 Tax=Mugilogobius chulae TaxID=88201 RepID=A0AAW0NM90_9GOBI